MRAFVFLIGIIVLLAGASELLLGRWWVDIARPIMTHPAARWLGLINVAFGLILLIAASARLIGLRDIITVFSILSVVVGIHFVMDPGFWTSYMNSIFFDRSPLVQANFLVITGLIRITAGCCIVYAALCAPRRSTPALYP